MALINYSEFNKTLSNNTLALPGFENPNRSKVNFMGITKEEKGQTELPDLPKDLNIGDKIRDWDFNTTLNGYYDHEDNDLKEIPHGKCTIILHTHGINVCKGFNHYPIHNSQIVNIKNVHIDNLIYMIINYWDIKTQSIQSLAISGKEIQILSFIARYKNEIRINSLKNRVASKETKPVWFLIYITAIVLAIITIFPIIIKTYYGINL
jgi:hypothetical protein